MKTLRMYGLIKLLSKTGSAVSSNGW